MKNPLQKLSMHKRMMLYFSVPLILVQILLCFLCYPQVVRHYREKTDYSMEQSVSQAISFTESYLRNMTYLANMVEDNGVIQNTLSADGFGEERPYMEQWLEYYELNKEFNSYEISNSVYRFCLYVPDEVMYAGNKYPLLFSSGEEFDMAYSASWLNFASLAQKGAFKSLDELWPTYAPKNFAAQTEEAKQQATVNGSYYCVPSLLSTYNAYGPFYRGDLVEGTEWDGKMETFEDIEEYCDIIKETHPEMECIDLYSTAPEIFFMYMENQGLATFNGIRYLWYDPNAENPTVMTSYELEKTPEFLEMMARWNEKGFYSKSALSDTDSTKFQNGKAALKIHNIDSYVGQAILHPEYDIHYSNMVKDVAHLPYTQDCMVISNTSKNPERAMALWDLITNDQEVYDAFYYGIEGTSYELNDEGQFKILDTDNYGTSAMWSARSDALNRQQIGTPDDYKTNIDEFESHIVSGQGNEKFTGFVLDTSSFETQLAACNNVQQQYWWPLELGYTDAESGLADYQSQMEAAGIEAMKEAAQKQLDAYVASLK